MFNHILACLPDFFLPKLLSLLLAVAKTTQTNS
jgi:hypothetical protein